MTEDFFVTRPVVDYGKQYTEYLVSYAQWPIFSRRIEEATVLPIHEAKRLVNKFRTTYKIHCTFVPTDEAKYFNKQP